LILADYLLLRLLTEYELNADAIDANLPQYSLESAAGILLTFY